MFFRAWTLWIVGRHIPNTLFLHSPTPIPAWKAKGYRHRVLFAFVETQLYILIILNHTSDILSHGMNWGKDRSHPHSALLWQKCIRWATLVLFLHHARSSLAKENVVVCYELLWIIIKHHAGDFVWSWVIGASLCRVPMRRGDFGDWFLFHFATWQGCPFRWAWYAGMNSLWCKVTVPNRFEHHRLTFERPEHSTEVQ